MLFCSLDLCLCVDRPVSEGERTPGWYGSLWFIFACFSVVELYILSIDRYICLQRILVFSKNIMNRSVTSLGTTNASMGCNHCSGLYFARNNSRKKSQRFGDDILCVMKVEVVVKSVRVSLNL